MSEQSEEGLPEVESSGGADYFPIWAHVLPFVAWLFIFQMLGDPAGWKYAVRSVLCLGIFFYFRPWRWYARLEVKNLPLAVGVGLAVFIVWIAGETAWMGQWPMLQEWYMRIGFMPPWSLPELDVEMARAAYAPDMVGWPLTAVRILGSAFVIGIIEEFFWRGFLYRWLLAKDFLSVDPGKLDLPMFLLVALVFGVEHNRWLVGVLAGLAYGWMYLRTRDIWAVSIAHALTNLVLGIYVVWAEQWAFWS